MKATTTQTITTAADILNAKTADLVAFYNERAAKPVTKFADRRTAEKRCTELLKAQPVDRAEKAMAEADAIMAKMAEPKAPKAKKAKLASAADVAHLFGNDVPAAKVERKLPGEKVIYKCAVCGRTTYLTENGGADVGLCPYCYEEAGLENSLADGNVTQAQFDTELAALKATYRRDRAYGMTADVRARMSAQQAVTWDDPEVRAARAERSAVVVDGVQYKSVRAAFADLGLAMSKHIPFRMRLKEEGVIESAFDHRWEIIPLNY